MSSQQENDKADASLTRSIADPASSAMPRQLAPKTSRMRWNVELDVPLLEAVRLFDCHIKVYCRVGQTFAKSPSTSCRGGGGNYGTWIRFASSSLRNVCTEIEK